MFEFYQTKLRPASEESRMTIPGQDGYATEVESRKRVIEDPRRQLVSLLASDLDFHNQDTGYASHNFHSFPAKFPPQLPAKFINGLTAPGEVVLDPMMGSGTTVVEAHLSGRTAVGFDIDPMAALIAKVKVTPIDRDRALDAGLQALSRATDVLAHSRHEVEARLCSRWTHDAKTRQFVDYWFAKETQLELLALIEEIERVQDSDTRTFLQLAFSATIITKTGGVSLALDLAHTRPHKALLVQDKSGNEVYRSPSADDQSDRGRKRLAILSKTLRSPLEEFQRKLHQNVRALPEVLPGTVAPKVGYGNAEQLPLASETVKLIVTSPPYASNAIDYMRAHKFSLVWMDYPTHSVSSLGAKRGEYIGGESVVRESLLDMPTHTASIIEAIGERDGRKAAVLHRYYSEMARVLREMHRVLQHRGIAIVVVGSSTMRGIDTDTGNCLGEIASQIGFDVPTIGIRALDRNRRMLPAGQKVDSSSQIQQRMHEESVIGLYKP